MIYIKIISKKLTKNNCLGIGDAKLFAIGAAWIGLKSILIAISIAFITAGIYSLFNKIFLSTKQYQSFQFTPFISFSILSVWTLSEEWWIEAWTSLWGFK
tara:strand:- start:267 stop:566 length:300 start_codon:yes stop_codon:yes gene_type:complete